MGTVHKKNFALAACSQGRKGTVLHRKHSCVYNFMQGGDIFCEEPPWCMTTKGGFAANATPVWILYWPACMLITFSTPMKLLFFTIMKQPKTTNTEICC